MVSQFGWCQCQEFHRTYRQPHMKDGRIARRSQIDLVSEHRWEFIELLYTTLFKCAKKIGRIPTYFIFLMLRKLQFL